MSSDERDFEADETDYLLESPSGCHRFSKMNRNRPGTLSSCKNIMFKLTCG